jgi:hypothetical protein
MAEAVAGTLAVGVDAAGDLRHSLLFHMIVIGSCLGGLTAARRLAVSVLAT